MELDFNSPLRGLAAQATRYPGGAKADIVGCPSWVKRVILTVRRLLPVYPD